MSFAVRDKRLVIVGNLYGGLYNHIAYEDRNTTRSITVSISKPATTVARDITRRLLPQYLGVLERAVARKAMADAYEAGRQHALETVTRYLCGDVDDWAIEELPEYPRIGEVLS